MKKRVTDTNIVGPLLLGILWILLLAGPGWGQNRDNEQSKGTRFVPLGWYANANSGSTLLYRKTTSVHFDRVPLEQALVELANKVNVRLSYAKEQLPHKKVTLSEKNITVIKAFKMLFHDTDMDVWASPSGQIVIKHSATPPREIAVQETISGRVTDSETGNGLPGVNIAVKGSTSGTSTDADGNYSLEVSSLSDTLVVSFIGYQTREVPIDGRTQVNIALTPTAISGEEVVVIGYGTSTQRDLTGSVSNVTSDEFNTGTQLSPQQLIQGKLSGVNITQNSGKPGGSNTVRIRGGTSISASNDPLYVIDGVPIATGNEARQVNIGGSDTGIFDQEPVNPLNTLNPSDIESITVLKDASATAIYGSRGANGVIVITTKDGAPGSIQTDYNVRLGMSTVAKKLDMLSADQWRQAINDVGINATDLGENTNWQDEIFRTGFTQDHNLSLSGGNQSTQYRGSLSYGTQEGIVLGSQLDDANARINVNHSAINDRLRFDLRLTAGQLNASSAPISNTVSGESGTNMLWDAYVFNPTYPVVDENGEYVHVSQFTVNPVSYKDQIDDERITRRVLGSLSTTYDIFDALSVNVNLGYTYQNINRNSYISSESPIGGGFGGLANSQTTANWSELLETTLRYQKDFGGAHSINAIAGYSYQYFVDEGNRARVSGFISDSFKWYSLEAGNNIQTLSSFKASNTLISYYGRVNYSYKDRYLVTGTIRRDGSSRFGSGNKWGIFPSGSVAWRISEEDFFSENVINDLKVRVSYGITGNQEIGNLNSLSTLGASSSGYVVGGVRRTIVLPEQYANPDLKWEETSQFDIGIDFEAFEGRFYGKVDYYKKSTTDLLLSFDVPSPSVVSTQLANVGEVQNKGIEIEVGSRIIQKQDFLWKTDLNFSANRNEVISLSNSTWSTDNIELAPVQGAGLSGVTAQLITPGQAIGTFYGRTFTGVQNGEEQFAEGEGIIGNAQPDFTFGFSNSFFYKNWDLQFNLRGSVGGDLLNLTALNLSYLSNLPHNVLEGALTDGVDRLQPKQYSSRWIEDGSFLRLDNLSLGYTFDVSEISFLRNARVYFTGQNLFVITGYSGIDPEVNSDVTGSGTAPLGIDYLAYPKSRTFSIGANIGF